MSLKPAEGINATSHHIIPTPLGQVSQSQIPPGLGVSFEDVTDLPTTLAGYGITDAYTKAEVDDLVSNGSLEPVTNGDPSAPELVFTDDGDVIMG